MSVACDCSASACWSRSRRSRSGCRRCCWIEPVSREKELPTQSRSIRVLKILEAVAGADHPLRPADLMETCGLPKATVHRICALLSERGYLRQPIGARAMVPGPRLLELANAVLCHQSMGRSEERRVGYRSVRTCRLRWWPEK